MVQNSRPFFQHCTTGSSWYVHLCPLLRSLNKIILLLNIQPILLALKVLRKTGLKMMNIQFLTMLVGGVVVVEA